MKFFIGEENCSLFLRRFFLTSYFLLLTSVFSGCIGLKAGTWYKGAEDPYPKTKEIGFDTRDLVPGQAPGSIEIAE